jgi:hypothetical protein
MHYDEIYFRINGFPHFGSFKIVFEQYLEKFKEEFLKNLSEENLKTEKFNYITTLIYEFERVDDKYFEVLEPASDLEIPRMLNKDLSFPVVLEFRNTGYPNGTVLARVNEFGIYIKDKLPDIINYLKLHLMQVEILPDNEPTPIQKKKIKTNLTVAELAYLFSSLYELKPDIFDLKTDTELYNFISENFTSKKSEEISQNSLKKLFYEPDLKAVDFWMKHFSNLLHNSKKIQ